MAALTAYVRKTGSDNNGGSSNGTSAQRTGTDGVTNGTTTFTSATASFTSGDVDKLINIVTKGRYRITAFTNSTTVTLSGSPSSGSSLTWNIGGAVATIGAILANTNNAFQSADTCYIGPGTYREVVTVSMTSAVAETQIIGDVDGSHTGDTAGEVVWTAYTTDDTTTPSANPTLNLNARDFLTFKNLVIIGGGATGGCVLATTTNSVSITFRDCTFLHFANNNTINYTGLADVASNWIIDRCIFLTLSRALVIVLPTSTTADYDTNFLIQNCFFLGPFNAHAVRVDGSGANSFKGGGVDIFNSTFATAGFTTNTSTLSTSIPCTIYNSIVMGAGAVALVATTSGQILEDYNYLVSGTPRTNVTAGANSQVSATYAPLLEFGQSIFSGKSLRPFMMPSASSPLLGRGAQAGGPTVDIFNINRPAGGASTSYAWGYMERHNTGAQETSVTEAGSTTIKITGPGDQDLPVPVDASSTTITIRVRYDTNHGTGSKPQVTLMNGEEIGVTTETKTATVGVDTWETLTFSSFTPSAKGIVTLRCISRSAAGNGIAYFDTVTGGASGSQGLDYFRRGEILPAAVASAAAGGPVRSDIRGGFVN